MQIQVCIVYVHKLLSRKYAECMKLEHDNCKITFKKVYIGVKKRKKKILFKLIMIIWPPINFGEKSTTKCRIEHIVMDVTLDSLQ